MEQTTTDAALLKSRARILLALRIGAVICAVFAFQTALLVLGMRSMFEGDMVIANKYISESEQHQYRISCEQGGTLDTSVTRRFYDAAKTGDTIRSPFNGYLQLVREKKIIARDFSDELIVPGVIFFACILPLSAFLKLERTRYAPFCMVTLTFIECLMIGLILFLMFQG